MVDPNNAAAPLANSPTVTPFVVPAITLAVAKPPDVQQGMPNTITGTVTNYGSATQVDVVVKNSAGAVVGTYPATITGGVYTVNTPVLPPGSYTVDTVIHGMSGPTASTSYQVLPAAITVGPQPTVNSTQQPHITGTVSNPGPATTVALTITDSHGTVVWSGTAPLLPNGTYAVDSSVLPKGDYTVSATANGVTATTPLKVIDPPTQITVDSPGTLTPSTTPKITGTVQNPGTATTVDLKITDSSGAVVWQGSATINPDGSYSTPAATLPIGDYTVTATANGVSSTATFAVADPSTLVNPVPTLGAWALMLLSAMVAGLGLIRRRTTQS